MKKKILSIVDTSRKEPFSNKIEAFNPPDSHKDLFGSDVGEMMTDEINKILSVVV